MTTFIHRPRPAGRFGALLPALFLMLAAGLPATAHAQPLSVVVKSSGSTSLSVTWAAPGSGAPTQYNVRWAEGAGGVTWINANAAAGVSAGTDLVYVISGLTEARRYDVQVSAVVSGVTTWSASVGGIVDRGGRGALVSLSLRLSGGHTIFLDPANREPFITLSADTTGVRATAVTLGRGEFGFGKSVPIPVHTTQSGATSGSVNVTAGFQNVFLGALAASGEYANFSYVIGLDRKAPSTATSVPGVPSTSIQLRDGTLRILVSAADSTQVDFSRVTWRTSATDGADGVAGGGDDVAAGKWQDASGDDAECAEADDPGSARDCGQHIGAASVYQIPGLARGTAYDARARSENGIGAGAWSEAQSGTPVMVTTPGAPRNLSVSAGARRIRVDWSAPADNGNANLSEYRVRWRLTDADGGGGGTAAGAWQDSDGDDAECDAAPGNDHLCGESDSFPPYTITGLQLVSYDVAVAAVNSAGAGAWTGDTAAQATPLASPDATLSELTLSAGVLSSLFTSAQETYTALLPNTSASLAITAVLNQENAAFTVQTGGGAAVAGVSGVAGAPVAIAAGASETFTIVVTAENGNVTKTYSVAARRIGPPGAPRNPTVTAGVRRIVVNWQPPASDGGEAVAQYRVRWRLTDADGGGAGAWQDASGDDAECDAATGNDHLCGEEVRGATTYTIAGLQRASYDVAVAAVNSAGAGAWSGSAAAQATPLASTDATLAGLRLSAGRLSTAFDPARTEYTAFVPNASASIAVIATLNQENATFTVQIGTATPTSGARGTATLPGAMLEDDGSATFTIVVTADDGLAMTTYRVVATGADPPGAPTDVMVTPGNQAYSVDWVAPAETNGAPIIEYRVRWTGTTSEWNGHGGADGVATGNADTSWNTPVLRGANAFTVAAVNGAGVGAWEKPAPPTGSVYLALEPSNPSPPANLRADSTVDALRLRWDAVADASGYKVRWKTDAASVYGAGVDVTATTTAYTIGGLVIGTYDVQVHAIKAGKRSIWANATFGIEEADNAELAGLTVQLERDAGGMFDFPLVFSAATLSYSLDVTDDVVAAVVVPRTAHAGASMRVTAGAADPVDIANGGSVRGDLIGGIPFEFRIVVTSANGNAGKTYIVTVLREPVSLRLPAQADVRFYADGNPLPPLILPSAIGGIVPYVYTLDALGDFPPGLSFNAVTRALQGTLIDTTSRANYRLVYGVADSSGGLRLSTNFRLSVAPPLAFAAAPPETLRFDFNAAAAETLPDISGGFVPVVLSLEGDALPAGLTFTAATRAFTGAPTQSGNYLVTYKAVDAAGADGEAAGIVRANITLQVSAGPADAPTGLRIAPANQRLRLRWSAPGNDGGEAPSGYQVRWAMGAGSVTWINTGGALGLATGSDDTFYDITGLTNGAQYPVQVAAVNGAGTGTWSASVESSPVDALAFVSQQEDLVVLLAKALPAPIVLAEAGQGAPPYAYTLAGLPPGLSFNRDTRTISGTPGEAVNNVHMLTYTVTDAATTTDALEFSLSVVTFDLDLDAADGSAEAAATAQDGIITARYLLGVRGAALVSGQAAGRFDMFEAVLKNGADSNALDVDGDADVDGDDGILIARYLLGLRGDVLVKGFAGADQGVVARNIMELLPRAP